MNRLLSILLGAFLAPLLHAEERFLLAADTEVIEVNRAGHVTAVLKPPGHDGIYDAWRLPDGGIAYAWRGGLAVLDAAQKRILDVPARAGSKGAEANSCAVLDGGARFALMDSGASRIRIVDRTGAVVSETALPDLDADPLHFRYRMLRAASHGNAFWVGQYGRATALLVAAPAGEILKAIPLAPLLKPSGAVQKAFAILQAAEGALFVSTSTGCQLLHVDADGKALSCWTAAELGLSCRYLLGMQSLPGGNVLIACGDYHLKTEDEGRDALAEIDPQGKVVWRLTRAQLVDQIGGGAGAHGGLRELHITNVHAYDSDHLSECLQVLR